MRERNVYAAFMLVAVFFMLLFSRFGARNISKRSAVTTAMSSTASTPTDTPLRIFCYGDSLTAGTSPPEFTQYPYAPHLERALQERGHNVMVRHLGLPGWTTQQLVGEAEGAQGISTAMKDASPVAIAIILAGTNDLGYVDSPDPIIQNIQQLHQLCFDKGVSNTIAIGIPSSGYQSMVPEASNKAQAVNQALDAWCKESRQRTYVPFPFGFVREDDRWSADGLHFSPKGYQILGESLAPVVQQIMQKK